ncbi:MAG: M20/M25/M40 family metallo-hydrolase, partial [Bacteroidales bacterium]
HSQFESRKKMMEELAEKLNKNFSEKRIKVEIKDQYYNMKERIEPVFHIVELAKTAMLNAGVQPKIKPVRGGTDGSRLSYMGLPCPNIFTGGLNYHGKHEFIPLESMEKAVQVIIEIVKEAAK